MLKFDLIHSLRSNRPVLSTLVAGTLALVSVQTIGCAEPNSTAASAAQESDAATSLVVDAAPQSAEPAATPLNQVLVGSWLGQAMLDEQVLEQKLATLPEAQQERMFVMAENFLSTAMAMEFRTDGTVESEIEMQPLGEQPIRDSTVGQWRVTQTAADQLAVETAELAEDGSTLVTKRMVRFYPDRNAFVMSVPVSEDLQGCDAVMIFERQSAVANVALGQNNAKR